MELSMLLGGGIKSNQSGFVSISNPLYGTVNGEDGIYIDVTIAAVDVTKSLVTFEGNVFLRTTGTSSNSLGYGVDYIRAQTIDSNNGAYQALQRVRARLINSTTLRLSTITNLAANEYLLGDCKFIGRWQVVETK
jgi:hypothetical protein